MSEATYINLYYGMPVEDKALQKRFLRQFLADQRPGWNYEYIDSVMDGDELPDLLAYIDGKARAMEDLKKANG